jgi:hypothetical protein
LLRGFGSGSGSSSRSSNFNRVDNNDTSAELSTANTFGSGEFYIPSYASSQYKPFSAFSVQENNTTAAEMDVIAALYSSTSAVTSIALFNASTFTFNAGSSFYLYGI